MKAMGTSRARLVARAAACCMIGLSGVGAGLPLDEELLELASLHRTGKGSRKTLGPVGVVELAGILLLGGVRDGDGLVLLVLVEVGEQGSRINGDDLEIDPGRGHLVL